MPIMKKFISIIVIMLTIIQSLVLYLFINDSLPIFQVNLVDMLWVGSALMGTMFGVLFFGINKETEKPVSTIITVALLGIIGFQLMLFNYWAVVLLLIIFTFGSHFYFHRHSKFTIVPVISAIMGIYSIVLYLLMKGITSM